MEVPWPRHCGTNGVTLSVAMAYGCILGSKHVACFRHLFRARGAFRYDLFDYSFHSALMIYEIFATSSVAFLFSMVGNKKEAGL
ncbi:hypothetical protein Tco_1062933 [Tanacetum coccineum]